MTSICGHDVSIRNSIGASHGLVQRSVSALQAVLDYVRMFGSVESEIQIVGVDSVAWRGARFSAVPVPADPASAE